MRAFLRRSLLSVRLVSPGLFIFLAVFPLLSSASVVAVNGEGGAYGRVFLNNGGGIADEFGWIGGGAGSPTYNLTPGGTTSFSDNGSATYNDNGPASNVSGSTNLAVTGSSVTGSGSITGNSTFDGTFSTYYFHFGTIVNSVVDLGGPNTAFTLTYTFQDNYAINNGAHVFWYGARAGTAYNSGDILSVNDGGPGLLFMTDGPGSVFITNTISGVTGIDGLLYLRFDVQAAGQWQGFGFDPYSVSSTSSWSFELNVDSPANNAVPIASPFMLMLFGLAGLAGLATGRAAPVRLLLTTFVAAFIAAPASASVVAVGGYADLWGSASDAAGSQSFGNISGPRYSYTLSPAGADTYAENGGLTRGATDISGAMTIVTETERVTGQASLGGSTSGVDNGTQGTGFDTRAIADVYIDLGGEGQTFTVNYAFHYSQPVSVSGAELFSYRLDIGTDGLGAYGGLVHTLVENLSDPTLLIGSVSGVTGSNGSVFVSLLIGMSGSGGAPEQPYEISSLGSWEFEVLTADAQSSVPLSSTLLLLTPGLLGMTARRRGSAVAC